MRPIWKGNLVLGEVSVPISLEIAAARERSGFRLLHSRCGTPINQTRTCPACQVTLSSHDEVDKGYEFATGQFVVFAKGELEAALAARQVTLKRFISPGELPGIYLDRAHWIWPAQDSFGVAAYAAIARGMRKEGAVGLAAIVLSTTEAPCLVMVQPDEDVLALHTLFTARQIRPTRDIWRQVASVPVEERVVNLAAEVIGSRRMLRFSPRRLERMFPAKLGELVAEKQKRGFVSVPDVTVAAPIDLQAALRKSVRKATKETKAKV